MSATYTSREIHLAARPKGVPDASTFALETREIAAPAAGHVVVRNTVMSVEPYMRPRMNDTKSYIAPFEVGAVLDGSAVGFVVASADPTLPEGTWVLSFFGWREYATGPAKAFRRIDVSQVPPSAYLGILGSPGFAAWVGLHEIGNVKREDVVFVSSAAGAVGSVAGQLAKAAGARTIGSVGSSEKVNYLVDVLGFDEAFDYHDGKTAAQLARCAPDGIDLFFDNVGGEQLEGAIFAMRDRGRIALCGAIAGYNDPVPGPRNLALLISKRLRMQGFVITDFPKRSPDFIAEVIPQVASGALAMPETFVEGIENAPGALLSLLSSNASIGKLNVRLAPEDTKP